MLTLCFRRYHLYLESKQTRTLKQYTWYCITKCDSGNQMKKKGYRQGQMVLVRTGAFPRTVGQQSKKKD